MSMFINYNDAKVAKLTTEKKMGNNTYFNEFFYPELESKSAEIKKAAFAYDGVPVGISDTAINVNAAHGNYRNYIFGKQMWAQMNIRPTAFTAIPRNQYIKSAFRILNDFATSALIPNAVNEYTSHIPDVANPFILSLRVDPRVIVNSPISMTLVQQALDGIDDTVGFDAILEVLQTEFSMRVNKQLLMRNYQGGFDLSGSYNPLVNYSYYLRNKATLPDPTGIPLCSLDTLISSKAEYDYLAGLSGAVASQCAAAVDLFNLDRHTAASNLDSYVDLNAANSNALRPLSIDLIDNAFQNIMPYWKDNTVDGKVILTGFDTVGRLQQLHYQYQRFIGYNNYQVTYNGIKTCPGDVVGFGVTSFKGVPIVPDLMTTKEFDTNTNGANEVGLSRIYVMDTNTVQNAVLIPPTFIQDKSYLPRRQLADIATYYMSAEMVCTKPRANAKIMLMK